MTSTRQITDSSSTAPVPTLNFRYDHDRRAADAPQACDVWCEDDDANLLRNAVAHALICASRYHGARLRYNSSTGHYVVSGENGQVRDTVADVCRSITRDAN